MYGPPLCRDWTPLATQQLRLRHLVRIIGYNVTLDPSVGKGVYYTLHLTTMCAPFFTSEKLNSVNPKWDELMFDSSKTHNSGIVIRIWEYRDGAPDSILTGWGILFSGLVYLGPKLSDIQPCSFENNTLVFQFSGGFFTSQHCIKKSPSKPLPFSQSLNIVNKDSKDVIFRHSSMSFPKHDIRKSYTVNKLQRLHRLQKLIKDEARDAQTLREQIYERSPMFDNPNLSITVENVKKNPQRSSNTLTMTTKTLHKIMFQQTQPSRLQKQEALRLRKEIESAKFRCKLLSQERDRKSIQLRQLTQKYHKLCEDNNEKGSDLMDNYRELSRDFEKLRQWQSSFIDTREALLHASVSLNFRRKQLMSELLDIYPINRINDDKLTIAGVHLPDSESLSNTEDTALSVALGYVTHTVQMCSVFLQVPLRYPVTHYGSRSRIVDHISDKIPDKEREFPLYSRGKDQLQFHYAIYLLNKNIAQLRWHCNLPTHDLRATLGNLLSLLQFRDDARTHANIGSPSGSSLDLQRAGSPPLNRIKNKKTSKSPSCSLNLNPNRDTSASSDIHVSSSHGLVAARSKNTTQSLLEVPIVSLSRQNCDIDSKAPAQCVDCNIEMGLDLLDPRTSLLMCSSFNEHSVDAVSSSNPIQIDNKRRVSRSVGSYTEDAEMKRDKICNSDPLLNKHDNETGSDQTLPDSFQEEQSEYLQEWLNSGPALVCSEENLYPEEILGITDETHVNGNNCPVNNISSNNVKQVLTSKK